MKIAAIVVCYNDDYKIDEWKENYDFYKESIYRLIIVDNGSDSKFLSKVKEYFPDATIIERKTNGGSTAAYNDGIRCALSDSMVEQIMLIGNDIRITDFSVRKMSETLKNESELGVVAPVLLNKDSDIVSDAGSTISYCFFMIPYGVGKKYDELSKTDRYVDSVTGGMNLAKREFYECVGLQDEKLFMYSDEVDTGTRARQNGYKMKVIGEAFAWHQHINPPFRGKRLPYSDYLMARNKVYLGRKFYGWGRALVVFMYICVKKVLRIPVSILKRRGAESEIYAIRGAVNGLLGKMDIPENMRLN